MLYISFPLTRAKSHLRDRLAHRLVINDSVYINSAHRAKSLISVIETRAALSLTIAPHIHHSHSSLSYPGEEAAQKGLFETINQKNKN